MCSSTVVRVPIKVKRKPITVATDNGWSLGKWFAFPRPNEDPPYLGKLRGGEHVLWCPWCDEWQIFKSYEDKWKCTGYCGWGNTGEWHTRKHNSLWLEQMDYRAPSKNKK